MPVDSFTTAGSYTWTCPIGIASYQNNNPNEVDVGCQGGGGGGGIGASGTGGGGGGGGASAGAFAVPVTDGVGYAVVVGAGGTPYADGSASSFNTSIVVADFGRTPTSGGTGGAKGTAGASTGAAWTYNGGPGGNSSGGSDGGGGGGCAGGGGAGTVGTDGSIGSGGTGGGGGGTGGVLIGPAGGAGGSGASTGSAGSTGVAPGGGGGGDSQNTGDATAGADGAVYFAYRWQVPSPASLDVTDGATGGGQTVNITGTGFSTGCTVQFGSGNFATGVVVNSQTSITCVTPAVAAGTVGVIVTNADSSGANTLASAFTFHAPTGSSVTPADGGTGGGTAITIIGQYLTNVTVVSIGGVNATSVVVISDTEITCITGANSAQSANAHVANAVTSYDLGLAFTYHTPIVVYVTVAGGTAAGNTSVVVIGQYFTNATGVTFGGIAATNITVNSDTSLSCTTPAHAGGLVNVAVINSIDSGAGAGVYAYTGGGGMLFQPNLDGV